MSPDFGTELWRVRLPVNQPPTEHSSHRILIRRRDPCGMFRLLDIELKQPLMR